MDISRFPPPPSPWPARVARDLELLTLSLGIGVCVWFGGGTLLAGQDEQPAASPYGSEYVPFESEYVPSETEYLPFEHLDLPAPSLMPDHPASDSWADVSPPASGLGHRAFSDS